MIRACRLAAALALLVLWAAPATAANPVRVIIGGQEETGPALLNTDVVVSGDVVRLGDLFAPAGRHANLAVTYAPGPGQTKTLDAAWLERIARQYRVAWRPTTYLERAVVRRQSFNLTIDDIQPALEEELAEVLPEGEARITFDRPGLAITLPDNTPRTLSLGRLQYNPHSGRFSVVVAAPAEAPLVERTVTGKAVAVVEVPVAAMSLNRDRVVKAADIETMTMVANRVPAGIARDPEQVIGQQLRRPAAAGRPLRLRDLRAPVVVPKGGQVTMTYNAPGMRLSARGIALEDGGMHELIRIRNADTHITVEAVVTGPDSVAVGSLAVPTN